MEVSEFLVLRQGGYGDWLQGSRDRALIRDIGPNPAEQFQLYELTIEKMAEADSPRFES